jgi:hypothetical protein
VNSFFEINKDKRGQAALVDSLFFIAIISALGTGLFYFAINYGLSSEAMLNSFYSSDFASDALKVITYVNITRDGRIVTPQMVVSSSDEFDYLFAMIKEDYAENSKELVQITPLTQKYIATTLYSVLKPFDASFDYIFFITKEGAIRSEQKFMVMIFALHKPVDPADKNKGVTREFYSCYPQFSNVIEKYIFPNAGSLDSSIGRISLCESSGQCLSYLLGINLWVSKKAEVFTSITNGTDTEFNCSLIEGVIVS